MHKIVVKSTMTPTVSIVIPCYNHGAYLQEAIESIEKSSGGTSFEIIIVDDGSTEPSTLVTLQELKEKGYNLIRQNNQGLAAARNNGIAAAKANYILPLDSDNKVHSNYLTQAVDILDQDSSVDVVYGNPIFFGDSDRGAGLRQVGEFSFIKMLDCNYIDACALYRKSLWEKVGGYDGKMAFMGHEDWEIWINMFLSGGKFHYLNKACFYYRVVANSMSASDSYEASKHIVNKEYIYGKHHSGIISYLLDIAKKYEFHNAYLENNKLKFIIKVALGYNTY
ncbi:glycosyltransferase family A protein [Hymenobacter sp. GOD-10R]|uniref:glycosyltransferase family 2 protein n=1 Tax=Hymenobacter sp. GOD-10R TaxID=3093922 RepID=UPI002D79F96F|nr:glycosyltransferase family A protein [Hymenobacter sp. GOD-10R]WRQ27458.1 glycosyltransferase family A protein [Hymenobacter sp. GOD-10R]